MLAVNHFFSSDNNRYFYTNLYRNRNLCVRHRIQTQSNNTNKKTLCSVFPLIDSNRIENFFVDSFAIRLCFYTSLHITYDMTPELSEPWIDFNYHRFGTVSYINDVLCFLLFLSWNLSQILINFWFKGKLFIFASLLYYYNKSLISISPIFWDSNTVPTLDIRIHVNNIQNIYSIINVIIGPKISSINRKLDHIKRERSEGK